MIVSAPGRVCLFGEHQDYLGLPVIAAAISLRLRFSGAITSHADATIRLPDIGSEERFPLTGRLPHRHTRDYLRSTVNACVDDGWTFSRGIDAEVRSGIPINSGTSSSSAFVVAWARVLSHVSDPERRFEPEENASIAHRAEVVTFGEPGGAMDHFATSIGGVIHLSTSPSFSVERLAPQLGSFVLADSGQAKDTRSILARVKEGVLRIVREVSAADPLFDLQTVTREDLANRRSTLSDDEFGLLDATVANRDITRDALRCLRAERLDHRMLGTLLHRHQSLLREPLGISTPKIDAMIQASYDAGALGAKINGSGGGGCMFAYAPDHAEEVREALSAYGRAWIVYVDEGVTIEER